MARTNKYTSLNFNDIYEKKFASNSSSNTNNKPLSSSTNSSLSKTALSNCRIHGNMLVLTRPTPKPISLPQAKSQPHQKIAAQDSSFASSDQPKHEPDSISLRPQGRTGSGPKGIVSSSPLQQPLPKTDRFVPPHLRPGFEGREEKPGPDLGGSPIRSGELRRPKSGGGYERNRRGGAGVNQLHGMSRPGSSGARPSSSG